MNRFGIAVVSAALFLALAQVAVAQPIEIPTDGTWVSAEISRGGEEDWYTFMAPRTTLLHAMETRLGSLRDSYIYLYGPDSQERPITQDDDGGEGLASRIVVPLGPGRYYVKVRAYNVSQTGTYSISVSRGQAQEYTQIQINGEPVSGNIETGGSYDWYVFRNDLSVTAVCSIETTLGTLGDTYMELYEATQSGPGSLVAADDDSGEGYASRIVQSVAPGLKYYVKVRAYSSSQTGTYTISVRATTSPGPTPVEVNAPPVQGDIGRGGEVDWFTFLSIPTPRTPGATPIYTIETFLVTLRDSYIELYGPDDQSLFVAADDDSGVGYASKIVRPLRAGRYFVKVRGYSASQTGTYTIGVRVEDIPVSFQVVEEGGISGFRYGDSNFTGAYWVIRDATAWELFYRMHKSNELLTAPLTVPAVDFNSQMVLVAMMGYRSTGGYSVSIAGVRRGLASPFLQVTVQERSPAPGQNVPQVITNPFCLATCERLDGRVRFNEVEGSTLDLTELMRQELASRTEQPLTEQRYQPNNSDGTWRCPFDGSELQVVLLYSPPPEGRDMPTTYGYYCPRERMYWRMMTGGITGRIFWYGPFIFGQQYIPPIGQDDLDRGWYWGYWNQKKPGTPADWTWVYAGRSSRWQRSIVD